MENYPGNSKASRAPKEVKEEKKIEPVVTGNIVKRKKPLGKRFLSTFFGSEDATSVWGYVVQDVLVPAAKDMIYDAFSQGVERTLFGDTRGRRGGSRPSRGSSLTRSNGPYTSYSSFSRGGGRDEPRRDLSRRARATHDFDEVIVETKVEADEVVSAMFERLEEFGVVTVADFYEMINTTSSFTDMDWGWEDLRGAGATRIKGGYLIDLPRPIQLDK